MSYAENTNVSVGESVAGIEEVITKYEGDGIVVIPSPLTGTVLFVMRGKQIRMTVICGDQTVTLEADKNPG